MNYILQIGEGNFLRAFVEDFTEDLENYRVVICQPRTNNRVINALKSQNCRYDIIARGRLNGEIINERKHITCVADALETVNEYEKLKGLFCSEELKLVISNTTEAGICFDDSDSLEKSPMVSYPAKLTALLYERYSNNGSPLVILPCELIENNGAELKSCVKKYISLWSLESDFEKYIDSCAFCDTLVDRIVTGHIDGDEDSCSVACEPYKSWIISAPQWAKEVIPFKGVTYADDLKMYRCRKVRILNGVHTMSVLAGYMCGINIVRDLVNDDLFSRYISIGLDEIKSTLTVPCDDFASSVLERFNNPFIDHKLYDISLNSVSKFKARCLDTILDYYNENNELPRVLTFSMSALIAYYLKLGDRDYELRDNAHVLEFFSTSPTVNQILSNKSLWGIDLTEINGFEKSVSRGVESIKNNGILNAVKEVVYEQAVSD
ncbi:MAG: tagaturonate reductase [Eubacterium sp.]